MAQQAFGVDTFQLTPSLVDPNTQSSRFDPGARLTIGKRLSEPALSDLLPEPVVVHA